VEPEPEANPEPVPDISPDNTVVELIDDAGPITPDSDDIPSHSEVIIGPNPDPAPVKGGKSGGCASGGQSSSWPLVLIVLFLAWLRPGLGTRRERSLLQ